jgi:hypothetical protein
MTISRYRAASAGVQTRLRRWIRPLTLLTAVAIVGSGSLVAGEAGRASAPHLQLTSFDLAANSGFSRSSTAVAPYVTGDVIGRLRWPGSSLYIQPGREYIQTIPATTLLNGIGLNYNLPSGTDHAAAIATLASAGIRSLRIEVNWGEMLPDGSGLTPSAAKRFSAIFAACALNGITPVILLNANSGKPQPVLTVTRRLVVHAPAGAVSITLDDASGLVANHSGLSKLADNWPAAGALITQIGPGGVVKLSKPIPRAIPSGSTLTIDTLTHLPLFPVGTPQFEDTAAAWTHFARVVTDFASHAGVKSFDVEIWNELSFASEFLDINNYYHPGLTPPYGPANFHKGGPAWELAARTSNLIHNTHPGTRVIWGFSNTDFYQTAVPDLPPGMDAQSYHPYKTRPQPMASYLTDGDVIGLYNGGWLPNVTLGLPEGVMALDIKATELPGRALAPWNRAVTPPRTSTFYHYMTEHGVSPALAGITDPAQAEQYKAIATLRALTFWLNKGVTKLDLYSAWDKSDTGWGLMPSAPAPPTQMSPALLAIQRMVATFAGAQPLTTPRQLGLIVSGIDPQVAAFNGDAPHRSLWYRDLFTFLPFQVTDHRFVISTYVMSLALIKRLPTMNFRAEVTGVNGLTAQVSMTDPMTGNSVPVPVLARSATSVTLGITATDSPRMLTVSD